MKRIAIVLFAVFALAGCGGGGTPKAEIIQARIVPFTNAATGKPMQMVLVDWKNTGDTVVQVIDADVTAYDASGKAIYTAPGDTVYANSTGIEPGESYTQPDGEGNLIMPDDPAAIATRVDVKITKVEEKLKM